MAVILLLLPAGVPVSRDHPGRIMCLCKLRSPRRGPPQLYISTYYAPLVHLCTRRRSFCAVHLWGRGGYAWRWPDGLMRVRNAVRTRYVYENFLLDIIDIDSIDDLTYIINTTLPGRMLSPGAVSVNSKNTRRSDFVILTGRKNGKRTNRLRTHPTTNRV